MLKRLLAVDGVVVVARFRDDGQLVEGYGMLDEANMVRLVKFAHDYKRLTQSHADQLSMFTQQRGWTPPRGWIVRGLQMTACSMGNLVCLVRNDESSLNEVLGELDELSHY